MKFKITGKEATISVANQFTCVVEIELTREQLRDSLWRTFADNDWLWEWAEKAKEKQGA